MLCVCVMFTFIKHYIVDIVMILQKYDWVFHCGHLAALGH